MAPNAEQPLDQLEAWLEWFAIQPGADQMPVWLEALRDLRSENRRLRGFVQHHFQGAFRVTV